MTIERSRLGIALQLTDIVRHRTVAGRSYPASIADARATAANERPFRRVYGISVSVASDRQEAVNFARRQVAGVLATKSAEQLAASGIDPDLPSRIRSALRDGGLVEASRWVPTEVSEVVGRSRNWGFDEHFVCFPFGPDLRDAVERIASKILPAIG